MGAKSSTLGETFLTNLTFIRSFPGMSSTMLNEILSGAKRFSAKFTDLRFLTGVYPDMNLHVLSSDQFPANLACHLTLARVSPQMFLVTITIESLESTDLTFVLLPALRLTMDLHVTPQVDAIAKGLVTNLAGARFVVAVNAHVSLKRCLQIESFVADPAEFRELLVVSSDVDLQVILRGQFSPAHVTDMRRAVKSFVNI